MFEERRCDICDRSESELWLTSSGDAPPLEMDADGLLLCAECQARSVTRPVTDPDDLPDELAALVGKSAGAIVYSLDLPYVEPYTTIIDAASEIAYEQDQYMSAWTFFTQWPDDTTLWRSPDGKRTVLVRQNEDGSLRIDHQ